MIHGKQTNQIPFSIDIGKKEHILVSFLPHIASTYFGGIIPLHHPLNLKPNWKEISSKISVVESPAEVVDAVLVSHVVEMSMEVVESVAVSRQFSMEMVPLLVCLSLEPLLMDNKNCDIHGDNLVS